MDETEAGLQRPLHPRKKTLKYDFILRTTTPYTNTVPDATEIIIQYFLV